jgi:hypothetical protein
MSWPVHQRAVRCTGRATPGARALMAYIVNERRDGARNWGIYNCRTVVGGSTTSVHGEGRALDVGFALIGGRANPAGTRLVRALLPHVGRLGIQCIIWNRTIWSRSSPRGTRYRGRHPHHDHVHIELNWNGARNLTLRTIRAALKGGTSRTTIPRPRGVLRRGSRGVNVTYLQRRLNQLGINVGRADGIFGPMTQRGVRTAQSRFRIAVDGIAGPVTIGRLWN